MWLAEVLSEVVFEVAFEAASEAEGETTGGPVEDRGQAGPKTKRPRTPRNRR